MGGIIARIMGHNSKRSRVISLTLLYLLTFSSLVLFITSPGTQYSASHQQAIYGASLVSGPANEETATSRRSYIFIVRFEQGEEISHILSNYRRDREGTQSAFEDWAQNKPALLGTSLERVTYSGEALLRYDPHQSDGDLGQTLAAVSARLNASPLVRYAELDADAYLDAED